jgi:hypothetical protein
MIGFFFRPMGYSMRAGMFAGGVLLMIPGEIGVWAAWSDAAGTVFGGLLVAREFAASRRARPVKSR